MKIELLFVINSADVLCVWENGDTCPVSDLLEHLEKNGPDFRVATLFDEEDMLQLSGTIQNVFAEKMKTSTVN